MEFSVYMRFRRRAAILFFYVVPLVSSIHYILRSDLLHGWTIVCIALLLCLHGLL
jgi:hypothetical protein